MFRPIIAVLVLSAAAVVVPAKAGEQASLVDGGAIRSGELERFISIYAAAIANNDFDEAEVLAKRIIRRSIGIAGRDSLATASALSMLAYAQRQQEQLVPARQNYQAALVTIQYVGGALSTELIRPLQGLGEIEMAMRDYAMARETYRRALHVSHVTEGPHNLGQVETLQAIAESYRRERDYSEALDIQDDILRLQEKALGVDSAALIPALQEHARWMRLLQLPNRERNTYARILDLQERYPGAPDLDLIPTLVALGVTVREPNYPLTGAGVGNDLGLSVEEGIDDRYVVRAVKPDFYLRRALRIALESPDSDWRRATWTALEIGDYYSRVRRLVRARLAYTEAWNILSALPAGKRVRRQELEQPHRLDGPYLPRYFHDQKPVYRPDDSEGYRRGSISFKYDVSKFGKTVGIEVIELQPAGMTRIADLLVDRLGAQIQRPRMADGVIVATNDLRLVHEFFYLDTNGSD